MTLLATPPPVTPVDPVAGELLAGDRAQPGHPQFGLVWVNPARVSGAPCFLATRVPVQNLFDSLAAGESLDDFLDGFDGVTREQAAAVLGLAGRGLVDEMGRL